MSNQPNKYSTGPRNNWRSPIVPKYYQVELAVKALIADMEPGTALPPEPDLAREHGVSRATLRTAINELVSLGLLHRIQGRGTFVAEPTVSFPLGYHVRDGAHPEPDEVIPHKVIDQGVIPAGQVWSNLLGISADEEVLMVNRVSVEGGLAMSFDTLVVPTSLAPTLLEADFESGRFFYTLLDHKIPITKYRITIESVVIGGELAEVLQTRDGLPGISLTRHGMDSSGRILAHVRIITRGDIGRYILELDGSGEMTADCSDTPKPREEGNE